MAILSAATTDSYLALAEWMAEKCRSRDAQRAGRALVVGIHGAQGSGKSTCAQWLRERLAQMYGLRVAILSLDDFYLRRAERAELAASIHPLLQTRGVPGTHDAAAGGAAIRRLRQLPAGQAVAMPVFDKSIDDRASEAMTVVGPIDLVLFEGWCVGVPAQDDDALVTAVNPLEAREDADGRWRRFVNEQLRGPYRTWFSELDALVMLAVPSWEQVFVWRSQQERDTAALSPGGHALMEDAALRRFMDHYERLTRHALVVLPQRADALLRLDVAHSVLVERMT